MLQNNKVQAILYSLLLFIGIAALPPAHPSALAEGRINIPQHVIDELKESARKDREEAARLQKKSDETIQDLWKIIEEAKRQRAQNQSP
jgi:hypothetical protein